MAAAYYYVKSGGTGTGNTGRFTSKQTGSFTTMGSTVYYPTITAALAATTPPISGDFILESNSSSNSAAGFTFTLPTGTGIFIESVSDTACDTYSAGAAYSTTGGNVTIFDNNGYIKGFNFTSTGALRMGNSNSLSGVQVYELCNFIASGAGGTPTVNMGVFSTSLAGAKVIWKNCNLKFGGAAGGFIMAQADFQWLGGSITAGSTAITGALFQGATGYNCNILVTAVDYTNLGVAAYFFDATSSPGTYRGVLYDCQLPTSWTGVLVKNATAKGQRFEMYNCDNGNTNYKIWIEDYQGTLRDETSKYLTAGETDGTTHIAWKITTNANASPASGGFWTPPCAILYTSTGSKTATYELLTDGQLSDQDVLLSSVYMGSASFPLGTYVDTNSDFLAGSANLTAGVGTGSWNSTAGIGSPTSSKVASTFTVNQKGFAIERIVVTKPSITLYVNPATT